MHFWKDHVELLPSLQHMSIKQLFKLFLIFNQHDFLSCTLLNILLSPLHTNYSNCHIKYIHSWILFKNDRTIETVKLILCLLLLYRTISCFYWSTEVTSASIKQITIMVKTTFWYQRHRACHIDSSFCSKKQSNGTWYFQMTKLNNVTKHK